MSSAVARARTTKALLLLLFLLASGWLEWVRFQRAQTWLFGSLYYVSFVALDPLLSLRRLPGAVRGTIHGLLAGFIAYLLLPMALVLVGHGKFASLYQRWEILWIAVVVSVVGLCWLPGAVVGWIAETPRPRAVGWLVFAGAAAIPWLLLYLAR